MRLLKGQLMGKIGETEGTIFKIKRFSVHDGPGIRTSVFLKGCPLNCIWCHSPEGISQDISIWYDKSLCIACGECVKACRVHALELIASMESFMNIDRNKCNISGECVKVCPTGAIQFSGYKTNVSQIIDEIEKDILYYNTSGGGVTLTGGEPLFQPDFSEAILKECVKRNIHTAIETSLFCDFEIIKQISAFVNLFFIDMKIDDQTQHLKYTGKSNEIIKENFRYLAVSGKDIIVRIPLIPGITDTDENKNQIRNFVYEIKESIPIEFISYNPLAGNNYKRLGIPFLLE
jgi:pyruvate formate lyase activating enzyme